MLLEELRKEIIKSALRLLEYRLVSLSGGLVAARDPSTGYVVITPSGMYYDELDPSDVVVLDINGSIVEGNRRPSVDTPAILYIFKNMPGVNGIVHTHQIFATAFSVLHQEVPCSTTTLANAVGGAVPVAEYASAASIEYGVNVVKAIGNRRAVLLPNHGVVAVGPDLKGAVTAAVYLEDAAKTHFVSVVLGSSGLGTPKMLPEQEIQKARELFFYYYGQKSVK